MKKPKPFDLSAPNEEEGEQEQTEDSNKDQKTKKFQYIPTRHRSGYTKQERLA